MILKVFPNLNYSDSIQTCRGFDLLLASGCFLAFLVKFHLFAILKSHKRFSELLQSFLVPFLALGCAYSSVSLPLLPRSACKLAEIHHRYCRLPGDVQNK